MAEHSPTYAEFQQLFPALTGVSEEAYTAWWGVAAQFLGDSDYWSGLSGQSLDSALNMLTAHLAYSANLLVSGEGAPVVITSATIDKVTIGILAPPQRNNWRAYLITTPYGQMLLFLLEQLSAGGFVYGGLPEKQGFRVIGGGFGSNRRRW
jgi:hypothetical protein